MVQNVAMQVPAGEEGLHCEPPLLVTSMLLGLIQGAGWLQPLKPLTRWDCSLRAQVPS